MKILDKYLLSFVTGFVIGLSFVISIWQYGDEVHSGPARSQDHLLFIAGNSVDLGNIFFMLILMLVPGLVSFAAVLLGDVIQRKSQKLVVGYWILFSAIIITYVLWLK